MKYKMILLACFPIGPYFSEIEAIPIDANRILLKSQYSIVNVRCEATSYFLCYVEEYSPDKRLAVVRIPHESRRQRMTLIVTVDRLLHRERIVTVYARRR